jgi:anaerobic selenocysteine-containing dehydrogenase
MAILKTTCPFCLFGCELGIISDRGQIAGIEYLEGSKINQGRLCARGNGAAWVLNHPRRLTEPLDGGKRINWEKALTELAAIFKTTPGNQIAFTLDKNLTVEEQARISGFARALNIETIGCSYLEPEGYFQYAINGVERAQLTDIEAVDLFIAIGDIFSQMPVLAKPVLDARYRERQHRLVVLDSIRTRTGFFADQVILAQPGTEPLVLVGVSRLLGKEGKPDKLEEIAAVSGVPISVIQELAKMVGRAQRVVIAAGTVAGRVEVPLLFSLAPQVLAAAQPAKIKFLGIGEARRMIRGKGFGEILSLIKAKKIKVLWNFGEGFPFDYPQLEPVLKKLGRLVATGTFIPQKSGSALVLPVPSNLEKAGSIPTLWGYGTLTNPSPLPSGAKSIEEILHETACRLGISFNPASNDTDTLVEEIDQEEVFKVSEDYLKERQNIKRRRGYPFILVGEKPAIEFQGFFVDEGNRLKLNPDDVRSLNLKPGAAVMLATSQASQEFIVEPSPVVSKDVVACSVNRLENRRLFEVVIDKLTGDCIIPFASARVWKKI